MYTHVSQPAKEEFMWFSLLGAYNIVHILSTTVKNIETIIHTYLS